MTITARDIIVKKGRDYYIVDIFIVGDCIVLHGMMNRQPTPPRTVDMEVNEDADFYREGNSLILPAHDLLSKSEDGDAILEQM